MQASIIITIIFAMTSSVLGASQIVMRAPQHPVAEYRAVFDSAPSFADINLLSRSNVAGFLPYNLPITMNGLQVGSRIGVMMM